MGYWPRPASDDIERVPCLTAEGWGRGTPTLWWKFNGPHVWVNRDDGYDHETGESYEITVCNRCGATIEDATDDLQIARAASAFLTWLLQE